MERPSARRRISAPIGCRLLSHFDIKTETPFLKGIAGRRELAGDCGGGCRRRHEVGNGCGRYIFVEEEAEALLIEGLGGSGELDGAFWIGGGAEGFGWGGCSGEEKLWSLQRAERLGQGKALV